jgi:hypothetical protein
VADADDEGLGSAANAVARHAKASNAQQIVLEIIVYDCTNFRGAHAPRVLAIAPSRSRTFFS